MKETFHRKYDFVMLVSIFRFLCIYFLLPLLVSLFQVNLIRSRFIIASKKSLNKPFLFEIRETTGSVERKKERKNKRAEKKYQQKFPIKLLKKCIIYSSYINRATQRPAGASPPTRVKITFIRKIKK